MAKRTVAIPEVITVGDLAKQLDVPATTLIGQLFKNGIMATVNENVDFDTATIVVEELDSEVTLEKKAAEAAPERVKRELTDKAQDRPPVVAVMGHVDHGKTSLLDAIRNANQAAGEAGGITQHISAYQIQHNDRKITFLDTPGHEAFAALREHGAKLTDVAIIVVAADDGIKPQTDEAIRYAQKANVKIVVAINKIDKEGANTNLVKQQLSERNLLVEDWGGDVVTVEVSAKANTNIDKLLDMVLLVSDVEELKAETDVPAEGLIIEAHMEQGRGAVATALVEHGVLAQGQFLSAGGAFAKVRTLETATGETIKSAGPSTPVTISGFKTLPQFGDVFTVHKNEKLAKKAAEAGGENATTSSRNLASTSSQLIDFINKTNQVEELRIIVRADVQGSLQSVIDSIQTLENQELSVRVIGKGVGNITENDIAMATGGDVIIYGFNVDVPVNIKQLAQREEVSVRVYKVIYELIDDIKDVLSSMLSPDIVETDLGRLLIRGVFRTTKEEIICGGEVTKGKVTPGALVRIERDGEAIGEAEVTRVQRQQTEAKEVLEGEMCGLSLKTNSKILLEDGDRLEFFTREVVQRSL